MKQLLILVIFLGSQYLLILAALKACEWQQGKKLLLDSFLFQAASIGAYFIYIPTFIYLDRPTQTTRYFFIMLVAQMTFGVGSLALWGLRKHRAESVLGTRPAFAAFAATAAFLAPFCGLWLWSYLTYVQ